MRFFQVIPVLLSFIFACTPFHQKEIEKKYIFSQIPVGVLVDVELSPDWEEAVLFAIQKWNETAGIELFEIFKANNEEKYSIIVGITFIEETKEDFIYAKTYFLNGAPYIIIVINNKLSFIKQEIKNQILVHEFGHVLGFFHEGDPESIMYYEIPYHTISKMDILEHHKRILKKLYKK